MLRFIILAVILTSANTERSAATPGQIRFAIENKYDDTGPGAKGTEYAYNTLKTLDEALVGYLNDPDTKLPHYERERAIAVLHNYKKFKYPNIDPQRYFNDNTPPISSNAVYDLNPQFSVFDTRIQSVIKEVPGPQRLHSVREPFKWQKGQSVKTNHLSLAHYTRETEVDQFHSSPELTFSYNPYVPQPTPTLSLPQQLPGSSLPNQPASVGQYTFTDATGQRRVIQFVDDRRRPFRT